MASKSGLITTFKPDKTIQPIYTGGHAALGANGQILATCLGEEALVTNLETGELLARVEGVGMNMAPTVMSSTDFMQDGEVLTALASTSQNIFCLVDLLM